MEMDDRKKRMLLCAALLVIFGGISMFLLRDPEADRKADRPRNIVVEIPEGEPEVLDESKSSAYKGRARQPNEIYYDRLGTEGTDTGHISLTSVAESPGITAASERPEACEVVTGEVFPQSGTRTASPGAARQASRPRRSVPVMSPEERLEYDLKRAETMRQVLMEEQEVAPMKEQPAAEPVLPETFSSGGNGIISSLDDENVEAVTCESKPVRCMFVKDEKVKDGQRVGIRILEDFRCGGVVIPQNTHLAAVCSLSGRLELSVNSFEMNGKIYPVDLAAYDIDGYEGIYCPETAAAKGRRKIADEVIGSAGTALSGLVGGMAGRIVRAGAGLLTSASGEQSVLVTSGYEFYLMEDKRK